MEDLTDTASTVPLPYASPQSPGRARQGPVLVLLTGLLLVMLSVVPWGLVFAALNGGVNAMTRDAVVSIFGGIGAVLLLLGLWLIVAATRRLLR